MLAESFGMNGLVVLFGLFLLGLWLEARRTMRALGEETISWSDAASTWESDYQTVMARREARQRLAQMRSRAAQEAAQAARIKADNLTFEPSYFGGRYELHVPEFRLIEGGGSSKVESPSKIESPGKAESFSNGGARTPMTREGRKIA